jgi:transposase-like protein
VVVVEFAVGGSVSEKLEIVQLTLKSGASVAEVARVHGVNANQVFKWRRAFERGELSESSTALVPVTVETRVDNSRETEKCRCRLEGRSTSNLLVEP